MNLLNCQERLKFVSPLYVIIREQRMSPFEIAVLWEDTDTDISLFEDKFSPANSKGTNY